VISSGFAMIITIGAKCINIIENSFCFVIGVGLDRELLAP
jgi:hypothetical protein